MTCDEAMAQAPLDSAGVRWAQAEAEGRIYLAVQYTAGRVLVELDAETRQQLSRRVVTEVPAGLCWRPVDVRES